MSSMFRSSLLFTIGSAVACNAVLGLDDVSKAPSEQTGVNSGGASGRAANGGASSGRAGSSGGATGGNLGGGGEDDGGESSGGNAGVGGDDGECTPGDERLCGEVDPTIRGNCAMGRVSCTPSRTWRACGVEPAEADACDELGDDANCDGTPNGGCPCVTGQTQPCGPDTDDGACEFGVSTCVDETWGPCEDAVYPAPRDCASNEDLNCDGTPDDTLDESCECAPGDMESCGEHPQDGDGICHAGTRTCNGAGPTSSWGSCVGSVGPAARNCTSSTDNDCDGSPDNTVDSVCQCSVGAVQACGTHPGLDGIGTCRAGTQQCLSGANNTTSGWGTCTGSVGPVTELCNNDNLNEDCDNATNENPPCACINGQTRACGNCNGGTQTCANGAWGSCTGQPGSPVTYYRDQDGDGVGNPSVTQSSCTGAPGGYVSNNSDCCDSDGNAKPGQTMTFATARSGCGGFDYNCDGSTTQGLPNVQNGLQCFSSAVGCVGSPGWTSSVPACGVSASYSFCSSCTVQSRTETQVCR
jgi:hypothetical protein